MDIIAIIILEQYQLTICVFNITDSGTFRIVKYKKASENNLKRFYGFPQVKTKFLTEVSQFLSDP